jgi:hypothetical protein
LEAHLAENPDDAAAHLTRGYHYCFLSRNAAAQQALEQAVALDGSNQAAIALLQLAQRRTRPVAPAPVEQASAPAPIEQLPTPADPLDDPERR